MGKISTPGEQVTSVCTNYQELLQSENFDRILRIVLRKIPVFQTEVILGYFEKLKTGEPLSEQEKVNLISFAENKNVEKAFKGLLGSFENPLDSKVEDETKQKAFSKFLKEIFGENGFENVKNGLITLAEGTATQVSEALHIDEDIQKRRQAWQQLAKELNIDEGLVEITDRIKIKGVADFYLNDSEDASYEELFNFKKGGIDSLPELSVRRELLNFIERFLQEKGERFLKEVMCMDTTKKGNWNFYLFKQDLIYYRDTDSTVHGLSINSIDGVESGTFSKNHSCSVRRVHYLK